MFYCIFFGKLSTPTPSRNFTSPPKNFSILLLGGTIKKITHLIRFLRRCDLGVVVHRKRLGHLAGQRRRSTAAIATDQQEGTSNPSVRHSTIILFDNWRVQHPMRQQIRVECLTGRHQTLREATTAHRPPAILMQMTTSHAQHLTRIPSANDGTAPGQCSHHILLEFTALASEIVLRRGRRRRRSLISMVLMVERIHGQR